MEQPPSSSGGSQVRVHFSAEMLLASMGPGGPGTSNTFTLMCSSLIPKGLLAVIVYSPVFFRLAYLIDRVEEVGVLVMVTMSEVLNSRPPFDQTEVGGGLPTILEAEITMVSPALTDTPSFMSWSIVIVGGSAERMEASGVTTVYTNHIFKVKTVCV